MIDNIIYISSLLLIVINPIVHASKDTLHHHWGESIFAKWAKNNTLHYFGSANEVFKRRYNIDGSKKWSEYIDGIMDFWHLLETLRFTYICFLISLIIFKHHPILNWYYQLPITIILIQIISQSIFLLLYKHLLLKK